MFSSFSSSAHCLPTFSEGSTTISCSRGFHVSFKTYCWMVLKTYLGDFRYCIYGYLLFLGDWWSGSKLRVFAKEDLVRQVAVAICFWYWTLYQHKFQLETESKGAEHGLILMNHHTELDWIYSWMVGIKSSDFELNSELGSCCKFQRNINSIDNSIEGSLHKEKWLLLGGSCRPTFLR